MPSPPVTAVLIIGIVWVVYRLSKVGSREPGLPPGPPTLPLLGNLHVFETRGIHLKLTEWARMYGDIYSIKFGPQSSIVISSPKLLREYVDLKGAMTSDRPPVYVDELISNSMELPLMRYDEKWRIMRKAAHDMVSREACNKHLPIQRAEATQLLSDLLDSPEHFYTHIYRYTASVVTSVVYGIHCPKYHDCFVDKFDRFTQRLEAAMRPGNSPPVDMFPWLKYTPEFLAPWKRKCMEMRKQQREIFFGMLDLVQDRMKEGQGNDCFMEYVIEHQKHYNLDREFLGYLGGSLLQAGIDTTAIFLQSMLACIITHPHVQKRAQEEIDRVIGSERAPGFPDWDNLPYVRALVSEVNRFCPVAPLAVPHAATADLKLGEYLVPKDSIIFLNTWGIYRHPDYYENPDVFEPERYLKNEFGIKSGADTTGCRNDFHFGAGRRRCPGINLANNSIALNTMNLLWAFNFNKAKDPLTGKPIEINLNVDVNREAVLLVQKPFKCEITPRNTAKIEVIRADFERAKEVFEPFEKQIITLSDAFV
ncbi:hypothetical protein QCA50_010434 [Cerrena zonata]|uniref:Cytochrome P450 n=1 Tax=Cerrena zonata TaxID=2478898 RepID=A0AAW0G7F0_9APHY